MCPCNRAPELFRPKGQWTLTAKRACEQALVIFPEERNMENEAWSGEENEHLLSFHSVGTRQFLRI